MSDQSKTSESKLADGEMLRTRIILIVLSIVLIALSAVAIRRWIGLEPVSTVSTAPAIWALKADYVDACSCDLACPCLFGGSPTHGYCRGASLLEIEQGHYKKVDLAGVTVLAVYDSGKWIKFLVDDSATAEQTDAVVELLPIAEGFFIAPVRDVRNVPISLKRTKDTVTIETEGTLVELEPVRNAAGEPIRIQGLPAKGFPGPPYLDHTQYKTVALTHDGGNEKFAFSGSNGFTARIDISSETQASQPQSHPRSH